MLINRLAWRQLGCAAALLMIAAATSRAQEPKLQIKPAAPDKPATQAGTLALSAKLVNLPVIARDNKGKLIQNLTKDDFTLQVDGHPQVIRYFDRDQDLPLTVGLLIDVSRSQTNVLEQERTASAAFIDKMLESKAGRKPDQAFVIQFGRSAELLQDLTDSHPKLQAAIKQVDSDAESAPPPRNSNDPNDPNDPNNSGGGGQGRQQRGGRGGGTVLYDAIYLASNELMAKQTGRKALIVLTDGVDVGSKKSLASAIEAAQRADVIVYTIYFKGQERNDNRNDGPMQRRGGGGYPGGGYPGGGYPGGGYPGGGGGHGGGGNNPNGGGGNRVPFVDGKKVLQRISGETGGAMFEVKGKEKIDVIYDQIAEELRSQYRLGYTPDADTSAEGYHRVTLTVPKQNKLYIQTREGYYTGNS
jgi:VWFA-related protein